MKNANENENANADGLPAGVTQQQIDAWKASHGKVKLVKCKRDDGTFVDYVIGRPDRETVDMWAHAHDKDDRAKARAILFNACLLSGDKTLFAKDINLESTVLKKITAMLEDVQSTEKEL